MAALALALADPGVCNAAAVLPDRVCRCMGGRLGRISEWQDRRFAEGRARDSIAFDEPGHPALDLSQPDRWYGAQHGERARRADWRGRVVPIVISITAYLFGCSALRSCQLLPRSANPEPTLP